MRGNFIVITENYTFAEHSDGGVHGDKYTIQNFPTIEEAFLDMITDRANKKIVKEVEVSIHMK